MISGFPWMLLGYGLHQSPYLIQLVDITGVYGLAALIVMVNIGLYKLLQGLGEGRLVLWPALLARSACSPAWTYGYVRLPEVQRQMAQSPRLNVAVVQGNIEQGKKWDPAYQAETIKIYGDLTLKTKPEAPSWWCGRKPRRRFSFYGIRSCHRG